MKILVAGGTGFIGQAWIAAQQGRTNPITVLGRDRQHIAQCFQDPKRFPTPPGIMSWAELMSERASLDEVDVVINLCGANIADQRWNTQRKAYLMKSRLQPASRLVERIKQSSNPPRLIQASGVGIYGLQRTLNTEQAGFNENTQITQHPQSFLQDLSIQWEATTETLSPENPATHMRFAPVLAPQGGLLARMLPLFRMRLGGPSGHGTQPFAWVSLDDAVSAIDFIIQHDIRGPVNVVAPHTVSQQDFAKALGLALHKPFEFRSPAWLLKILFGQMADELLLCGQNAAPEVLKEAGFHFVYDRIDVALNGMAHRF